MDSPVDVIVRVVAQEVSAEPASQHSEAPVEKSEKTSAGWMGFGVKPFENLLSPIAVMEPPMIALNGASLGP